MKNIIKATVFVFLAGLRECAAACSSSEEHACAYSTASGTYVFISRTDPCESTNEVQYCCPTGKLQPGTDYRLGYAKSLGCHVP
ncbi:hypothetical protein MJO28_012874 [Puccinia striiformis f. sp. tritici]|uniref:Uncharacterized protein n=1 Tax=Puccinia striiformis f. sp. tritici TaxID=168172 RepID=A0ACC0DYR3_9BASI|nr:hypothetical protein Pst134EA_024636 [Puccinia striiformis f. sp. tritici]KAH9453771.1 hypothetical protein Pst134EA_024636 [Puccinia striiformis f. sp. tritici]KAI7940589.1 hypothetical protein MJO28_012874 [Puccinia striiformis f. sp. tritici]KAI7943355.1 hypothetical protein MJO29_013199 [Puccinia striiformis f. sp. tritici]KAI9629904.1 hypothetical protein KEM48_012544 [Puccinia striiformis f. sp. tritici PST-130]